MQASEIFNVRGYSVIVTGGASGLGLGYAEALAANGARLSLLDLNAERIRLEVARLRALGYEVDGRLVDVTDHASLDRAFDELVAARGRLDVVFANAGFDSGPGYLGAWVGSERPRLAEGALEPRDRHQPERRLCNAARSRAPHEAAALGPHHRHQLAGGTPL